MKNKACVQGRVSIGNKVQINKEAIIRGPTVIGDNTSIGNDVYIGPYTSIGNNTNIKRGEIGNSIIMENCVIDINTKIIDSIIGNSSEIISRKKGPKGHELLVGENSKIVI